MRPTRRPRGRRPRERATAPAADQVRWRPGQQVVYRARPGDRGHALTLADVGKVRGRVVLPFGELVFRLDNGAVSDRPGACITPAPQIVSSSGGQR